MLRAMSSFFMFCFLWQKILLRTKHIKTELLCAVLEKQELVVCLDLWLSEFRDKDCKEMVVFLIVCFLEAWQELGGNTNKAGFKPVDKNCFL